MATGDKEPPLGEICNITEKTTSIPPGHEMILKMHENSHSNAVTYVVVVLLLYALALIVIVIKYIKTERYETRLSRLYDEFMGRERFVRLSKRRGSVPTTPAPSTTDYVDDNSKPNSKMEADTKV